MLAQQIAQVNERFASLITYHDSLTTGGNQFSGTEDEIHC